MEIPRPRQGFGHSRAGVWHAPISPEILSGAAGLSGVRDVLYGDRSRRALRAILAGLLDAGAVLGPCRLDRAKFKPGRKLTGYFIASMTTPSGEHRRGLEVVWSDDDGTPTPEAATLQDQARALGVLAPFEVLQHATAGLRISVAPLDPAFPHLVRLSDPVYVRRLLSQTYNQEGGADLAAAYEVTTVRYRPRQRHLLRYEPSGSGGTVFAKLYPPGGASRAVRVATAVADAVERAGPGVSAVRPLGGTPLDDVVLYPRIQGSPLSSRFSGGSVPAQQLRVAGALLRALHDGGLDRPDIAALQLPGNDLAAELPATARAAEHLAALVPDAHDEIAALLDRVGALEPQIPGEPPGFAHGDFKCDHLWVARNRLTVLDFDTCSLAEPALDLGKFLADLAWHCARHQGGADAEDGVLAAQRAFLEGYGDLPRDRLARARLVEVVILTKISVRRRRRFDPGFEQAMRADVRRAVARLRSLEAGGSREPA